MSNRISLYYRIAGINYRITLPRHLLFPNELYLAPFRTQPCEADHCIDFFMVDAQPKPEGKPVFSDAYRTVCRTENAVVIYDGGDNCFMRIQRTASQSHIQLWKQAVPKHITVKLILTALGLDTQLINRDGFLLHASYIEYEGKAILFTAPSGTGKSTQADLWCRLRGARLLNGDRAALRIQPDGVFVHGVPFCGSSGVSENVTLPLRAIVSLSQAPATTIVPLRGLGAFRQIWEGCTVSHWDREQLAACTDHVSTVLQHVPVFHLACTPDESAVIALERSLFDLR